MTRNPGRLIALMLVAFLAGRSLAAGPPSQKAAPLAHDKAFWRAIVANQYRIPPEEKPFALARELSGYLGSPDPELRDDLAYTILTVWIVNRRHFSGEELLQLEAEWRSNLGSASGESGTDSVFKRSFSALCLSSLAERELKTPFLGEAGYRQLLDSALRYLAAERDLRGFDAGKGWIHATAHTADLLAALAAHARFSSQDQASVLRAISIRLATADAVYAYGEQDRLANVIAVTVTRPDFALDAFEKWLAEMDSADRAVWNDSPPKLPGLNRFENDSYMLRALAAQLLQRPATPASLAVQQAVAKSLEQR